MSDLVKNLRNWSSLHGGQYSSELTTQAADLIEQQQARIAELEATVDTLHSALRHLHHNAKASGAEMGLALDVANEALESTPQQNLNALKREVARDAYLQGLWDANGRYMDGYSRADMCEEYLNKLYPSDKDGES